MKNAVKKWDKNIVNPTQRITGNACFIEIIIKWKITIEFTFYCYIYENKIKLLKIFVRVTIFFRTFNL